MVFDSRHLRVRRRVRRELTRLRRVEVRGAYASAPRIPAGPEYLAVQMSSLHDAVRSAVWRIPLLPVRFVAWAARCQDTRMRLAAAFYDECPTALLEELCHDADPAVARAAIASLTGAEDEEGSSPPECSEDPPDPL